MISVYAKFALQTVYIEIVYRSDSIGLIEIRVLRLIIKKQTKNTPQLATPKTGDSSSNFKVQSSIFSHKKRYSKKIRTNILTMTPRTLDSKVYIQFTTFKVILCY